MTAVIPTKKGYRNKQDVEFDANMVLASMCGMIFQFAYTKGMTTKDVDNRANWLRKQPEEYINKVSVRVIELETN